MANTIGLREKPSKEAKVLVSEGKGSENSKSSEKKASNKKKKVAEENEIGRERLPFSEMIQGETHESVGEQVQE